MGAVTVAQINTQNAAPGQYLTSLAGSAADFVYPLQIDTDITGGIFASTVDRRLAGGTSALVSGTVYGVLTGLYAGQVITSVGIIVAGAGVALTLSKVGLYNDNFQKLAASNDQGAAWQSVGGKQAALTAPFTITQSRSYYLCVLVTGGTPPTVLRGTTTVDANRTIGGGDMGMIVQTGQVDLPATIAPLAEGTGAPIAVWLGCA